MIAKRKGVAMRRDLKEAWSKGVSIERLADSPALAIALPNAYFDSLGIPRLTVG